MDQCADPYDNAPRNQRLYYLEGYYLKGLYTAVAHCSTTERIRGLRACSLDPNIVCTLSIQFGTNAPCESVEKLLGGTSMLMEDVTCPVPVGTPLVRLILLATGYWIPFSTASEMKKTG